MGKLLIPAPHISVPGAGWHSIRAVLAPVLRGGDGRLASVLYGASTCVVLSMSGFAIWATADMRLASEQAVAAGRISSLYSQAARAIASEESLKRKYRLDPWLGVRISIDDFGTGYTGLAQLMTLPVDEIKIDKSFVQGIRGDSKAELIVRSLVELAHGLGTQVVVEGVENPATVDKLLGYRCDVGQGYHSARPMSALAFMQWHAEPYTRPFGSPRGQTLRNSA